MLGFHPISTAAISDLLDLSVGREKKFLGFGVPRVIFSSRSPAEKLVEHFDFTSDLASGETISSATVAAIVTSGSDVDPDAILSGAASIAGAVVSQKITAGSPGVIYGATCTATTSAGQILQLAAYVAVLADV